jgi:hypothetical protein
MVNVQAKTRALRDALMSQNANQVAAALELPSIEVSSPPSSESSTPQKHKEHSLIIGDVDYGGLLKALLDTTAAAEMVSTAILYDVLFLYVHPN